MHSVRSKAYEAYAKRKLEHQMLVDYAKGRLSEEGYALIAEDATVGGAKVDLVASRDGRMAVVECYSQVQPKSLMKKVGGLRSVRLVVCVPDEDEAERLKAAGFKGEVWVAGMDVGFKTLKVPRAAFRRLMELAKPGEKPHQVIERLLEAKQRLSE